MFQYIRSARVEYVVRVSSVTSKYIGHWKVFGNRSIADRQTGRFAFTKTETQFYKLACFLDIHIEYARTVIIKFGNSVKMGYRRDTLRSLQS